MGGKPSREKQIKSMTKDCMKKGGIFGNKWMCKFFSEKGLNDMEKRGKNNQHSNKDPHKKPNKPKNFKL